MKGLSGITKSGCAAGCYSGRCVITDAGSGTCGHPCMTGIQFADKKPDVLSLYAEACRLLGVQNKNGLAA